MAEASTKSLVLAVWLIPEIDVAFVQEANCLALYFLVIDLVAVLTARHNGPQIHIQQGDHTMCNR